MRDALSVLDQLMSYGSSPIALANVRELLGTSAAAEVGTLLDALLAADAPAALAAIQAVVDQGRDVRQFARELVEQLRALLLLRAGTDPAVLELSDDERAALQRLVPRLRMSAGLHWLRLFSELDQQLRVSAHGQLPLEIAVLEAILAPTEAPAAGTAAPQRQPGTAVQPRAAAEASATPEPAVPVRPTARPNATPAPATPASQQPAAARRSVPTTAPRDAVTPPTEVRRTTQPRTEVILPVAEDGSPLTGMALIEACWPMIVRDIRVHSKTLQALLNSGVRPLAVRGTRIILQVDNEFLLTQFGKDSVRQPVEEVISKLLGATHSVEAALGTDQPRDSVALLRDQLRDARTDPLVKAAMNILDADIVGIEPPPDKPS
jgi:DNA polymerase-3 subunit gamma/tau